MRALNRLAIVLCVGILVAGAACGEEGGAPDDPSNAGRLQAASQGLCDAGVLAQRSDIRAAAEVFQNETHDYLHVLADVAEERDRGAAARLLEVKQRLEQLLQDAPGADPGAVVGAITDVQRAMGDAAEAVGLPAPLCAEGAS